MQAIRSVPWAQALAGTEHPDAEGAQALTMGSPSVMRILMATMARPHIGGVGTYINTLSTALRERGHHVRIVTPLGVTSRMPLRPALARGQLLSGPLFCAAYFAAQAVLSIRIALAGRCDIIHCADVGAANAARWQGIPIVTTALAILSKDMLAKGRVQRNHWALRYMEREERRAYNRSRFVLVGSRYMRKNIRAWCEEKRIALIGNPVDEHMFYPDPVLRQAFRARHGLGDDFIVLYAGQLHERKGVHVLLSAMKILWERGSSTKLIYAGDGPERSRLGPAIMLGAVPYWDMNEVYNGADVVVVPSLTSGGMQEVSPHTPIEAMMTGTVVVGSATGGIVDLIRHGETGLLVPEGDAPALARAIAQPQRGMGERGRRFALGAHSSSFVAASVEDIYWQALVHQFSGWQDPDDINAERAGLPRL